LYATVYGAAAPKVAAIMGCTKQAAQKLIDSMPITQFKEAVWSHARKHGGVIHTLMGRRLVYRGLLSNNKELRSRAERQVFNGILQGGSGDILKDVTLTCLDTIHIMGARLALSVHDELLGYCPTANGEALCDYMTKTFGSAQHIAPVPIVATFHVGHRWSDLH